MNKMTKERFGPWAVITGASSGIGKEMTIILAQKGINTVLVARDTIALKELSLELEKNYQVNTKVIDVDLSKEDEVKHLIEQCAEIEVGLLINSAGYALSGEFTKHSIEDELNMLNVNVKAPLMLSHHFGEKMKERKRGGILFLSSIMALAGASNWAHYNATKAHNLLLSEGLAQELKPYNINVMAIISGSVSSGFQKRSHTQSATGAMHPKKVAQWGLWMLTCKGTYIPGVMNKLIAFSTRINPRFVNSFIFSAVVKKLTNTKGI